jgi:hypothetical protein
LTAEESSLEDKPEGIIKALDDIVDLFKSFADKGGSADFALELLKFRFLIDAQDEVMADKYHKDNELYFSFLENNSTKKKLSDRDNDLAFLEAITSMVKPDYEPCNGLWNIITMLQYLLIYWIDWPRTRLLIAGADLMLNNQLSEDNLSKIIYEGLRGMETKEAFLDLSLIKIAYRLGLKVNDVYEWGRRDKQRTRNTAKVTQKKADIRKRFVLAIYEYGEPIAPGTKRSDAIRALQRQFDRSRGNKEAPWGEIPVDKNKFKTPGRDKIIEFLDAEGILERDFKKVGRFWLKIM